jgi:selenocysteine lyase/cysteine desulfurase
VQSICIGEFSVERAGPDYRYELMQTARKFEGTSRAFGAVAQLQASLLYLERIGIARIEEHTVGLAQQLHQGLVKQRHRVSTPAGNRSSIVTFHCTRPLDEARKLFQAAKVEVTLRGGQIRIAPALFNNADEIEKCLAVTRQLA